MMDTIAFKTLKRPKSPNTYLLAPEGLCEAADPDQISDAIPLAPNALFERLMGIISAEDSWAVTESDTARGMICFISTSRLFRYKDDVDILILTGDSTDPSKGVVSRLAIYSRSRVGHSDLGANAKRIKYLLECLNKMQEKA